MQEEFLAKLDEFVQQTVHETEAAAGVEIIVVIDRERQIDRLASEVDANGAKIITGHIDYLRNASVYHEVQHIRRALVEGVPRLVLCDDYSQWTPESDKAISHLDNNLEHLTIVPQELEIYPNRWEYWEERVRDVLRGISESQSDEDDKHRFALLAWVLVNKMVPSAELKERAWYLLGELGIRSQGNEFLTAVHESVDSKELLVRTTFIHLGLPLEAGCLEYISPSVGTLSVALLSGD